MADALDDLIVYQEAVAAEKEIVAILARPTFRDFRELREQMDETCARGEAREMCGHLSSAHLRGCISADERQTLVRRYTAIAKMLSSLARHLQRENRKFRA